MTLRARAVDRALPPLHADARGRARARITPAVLLAGLALIVASRWAGTRAGLDPLLLGVVFGTALLALTWTRPTRPAVRNLVIGSAAGLALVGLTGLGAMLAGVDLPPGLGRPAAPFVPWALATVLVASGQEALLRGRLFDATRHAGGTGASGIIAAVALTTVAFALLHVPLYGWYVVPLDLGVGLGFAGLRLLTRGVAAPAAAHTVADLATWWL